MDATFVLVPGAGGAAWYWHRVVAELERRGRAAIAVDLPAADDSAGLAAYTDVVVEAIGDRRPVVLVAQSFGGFTAPLVCERVPVELLILVNAMVPRPGETFWEWGTATDWKDEVGEIDMDDAFFHDVPDDVKAVAMEEEAAVGDPAGGAVAAREVARRADAVRPGPRRPVLPARVPAPRRAGAARDRAGRGSRRAPRRPQPAGRARRRARAARASVRTSVVSPLQSQAGAASSALFASGRSRGAGRQATSACPGSRLDSMRRRRGTMSE